MNAKGRRPEAPAWTRRLRLTALLASAAVLPCCTGNVGEGDMVTAVTVRVSVGPQGEEGNGDSFPVSLSWDGRYVAFGSRSSNLTVDDANGFSDILVKDRVTGQVENLTNAAVNPAVVASGDAGTARLSADGRYVAFLSTGRYNTGGSAYSSGIARPILYDRWTGAFTHVLGPGSQYFNDETTGLCLSSDGRYLAFATAATNTGFTPNGNAQIYLCDFGPGRNQSTLTLVSHAMGSSTVGCDNVCYLEQHGISADGEVVVFDGLASDLTGTDGDGQPDIYYWRRSTGVVAIASVPSGSGSLSYGAAVSGDGTTIGYVRQDVSQAPFPRYVNCELYTIATGLRRRISPDNVHVALSWPVCLSFDGSKVLYVQDDSPTMPLLLYIEGQGTRPAVASTTGDVPLVPVSYFTFSGDGRWIGFATLATNMVPDDTNGFYDVFIRGPQ